MAKFKFKKPKITPKAAKSVLLKVSPAAAAAQAAKSAAKKGKLKAPKLKAPKGVKAAGQKISKGVKAIKAAPGKAGKAVGKGAKKVIAAPGKAVKKAWRGTMAKLPFTKEWWNKLLKPLKNLLKMPATKQTEGIEGYDPTVPEVSYDALVGLAADLIEGISEAADNPFASDDDIINAAQSVLDLYGISADEDDIAEMIFGFADVFNTKNSIPERMADALSEVLPDFTT